MQLTILMALSEVFQIFYVDEMVTGVSHHLCRGQIHVLWDSVKEYRKAPRQMCLHETSPNGTKWGSTKKAKQNYMFDNNAM